MHTQSRITNYSVKGESNCCCYNNSSGSFNFEQKCTTLLPDFKKFTCQYGYSIKKMGVFLNKHERKCTRGHCNELKNL